MIKMKMLKKFINNIIIMFILLFPFVTIITKNSNNIVFIDKKGKYCDIKCFLTKNEETIKFFSNAYGINYEVLINDLINVNKAFEYDEFNIGRLLNNNEYRKYDSFELGFIEYVIKFAKNNPELVDNSIKPYRGDDEYIIDLIKYYTSIYDNVDYLIAVSIGAAESGYYKVKYMLESNNVYGGISNGSLIKYKNIEYGVHSYIRMLSYNYFGRGLNTLSSIGKVYCPVVNEAGVKTASSHWINLVTKAQNYYKDSESVVTVDMLIN